MWLTHKNNIVRGLVGKYNNIIPMEMRQVFSNFGSLKNDVLRVLIEPLRFLILILKWFHVFIQDHGAYKHKTGRHGNYVVVLAEKAPNNIVFVCNSHFVDCLIKELGIDN
jgi:hypothetical protein